VRCVSLLNPIEGLLKVWFEAQGQINTVAQALRTLFVQALDSRGGAKLVSIRVSMFRFGPDLLSAYCIASMRPKPGIPCPAGEELGRDRNILMPRQSVDEAPRELGWLAIFGLVSFQSSDQRLRHGRRDQLPCINCMPFATADPLRTAWCPIHGKFSNDEIGFR